MMNINMTVTSFWYLLLIAVGVIFYYLLPKCFQWRIFLVLSLIFYLCAAVPYTFLFLMAVTFVAYTATLSMDSKRIRAVAKVRTMILWVAIILVILPWVLTNGQNLWISGSTILNHSLGIVPALHPLSITAAMGTAYYTSQLIAYIVDCYWGTISPQKNPVKLLTFACFFPQLTAGPVSRYDGLKVIFDRHYFKYENICYGAQRILWGFFKKLVLADRVGIIVNCIWGDMVTYTGLWYIVAMLLYPVQIYADFSGCMDIAIGTAQLFDIRLEENFNNPFFSRSIREFWSRWHITLGKWAKDYVMYPVLKAPTMVEATRKARKKFGKYLGKYLTSAFAAGAVWLVMGVWHGGIRHIVGVSLFYWILIELGELSDPLCKKVITCLNINTERFSWKLFQMLRTYLIYCVGAVFFRANSLREAILFLKSTIHVFIYREFNPWIFFDGSILNTGITHQDINIIIIGGVLLITVAVLRAKNGYARNWIAQQGIIFRWMIWIFLFLMVLIFGAYGPGYEASTFIYQRF